MQVSTSGQMQQMQLRKMDGTGGGQNNGMKDIMQSLSPDDRTALREQMASLSQTDRTSMKDQLSQIDTASLSSENLAQTMFDMLNSLQSTSTTETSTSTAIDIYA